MERKVASENPETDQWRMLSHYSYARNIQSFFAQNNISNPSDELIEAISGSILQAQAYFKAEKNSPLDIAPLLLYYGTTSLLYAACLLKTGTIPRIKRHGMDIELPASPPLRIADILIRPSNSIRGGLQNYCNT